LGIKPVAHGETKKFQWTIFKKAAEVGPKTIGPELRLSREEAKYLP
jgi:hypothetical protein